MCVCVRERERERGDCSDVDHIFRGLRGEVGKTSLAIQPVNLLLVLVLQILRPRKWQLVQMSTYYQYR